MAKSIVVGIADMNVCKAPDTITTIGLGSCIGIVLYDGLSKIAGLVHIMLPDSTKIKQNQNKLKFADTGIEELVKKLNSMGIGTSLLHAKIAGGAKMFSFASSTSDLGSIGDKNIMAVKRKLMSLGIRIEAEDVGLDYGRTIIFDPETSQLTVKHVGKDNKII
ncbi:MAG: chemotaxis protein CheD [Lachnospiraceae bacterium]|nr:chemotaxis protein CheD [Lachnospiraceae bacterium]